jgi:hypothetical protein
MNAGINGFSPETVAHILGYVKWSWASELRVASRNYRLRFALELNKEFYHGTDTLFFPSFDTRFEATLSLAYVLSGELFQDKMSPPFTGYFYHHHASEARAASLVRIYCLNIKYPNTEP